MDNLTHVLEPVEAVQTRRRGGAWRIVSFVAVIALMGAALVIARDAGTPSVDDNGPKVVQVSESGTASLGAPASLNAQINIQAIVCPILNALANGPLGTFIGPIINALRAAFGCSVSG